MILFLQGAVLACATEFVPNRGQYLQLNGTPNTDVLYAMEGGGTSYFVGKAALYLVQRHHTPTDSVVEHRVDVVFVGGDPAARIEELDLADGTLNYYVGGRAVVGVQPVRRVLVRDLYPHIDLVLYSVGSSLKYDFVVHPGGNPKCIRMRYRGMDALSLSRSGSCIATTSLGTLEECAPVTYQGTKQHRRIPSHFELHDSDVTFRVGRYDVRRDLIIDPQRIWATYYGGTSEDRGSCVRTDPHGDVVMAGLTSSDTKIATTGTFRNARAGGYDSYVVKFTAAGTRLWGTYFGGNGNDMAHGLAIDADDNIYVAGTTTSTVNLATFGAFLEAYQGNTDLFVMALSSNGLRRWTTYMGGPEAESCDFSHCVAMTSDGRVAIAGITSSEVGIATAGAHKGMLDGVAKLDGLCSVFNTDGRLQWSTYVGGTGADICYGLTTDAVHQRIVLTGYTNSADAIATAGSHQEVLQGPFDAFVMSFTNEGVRQWGTYWGGEGYEYGIGITADTDGTLYSVGLTSSANGIASPGTHRTVALGTSDVMLARFDYNGARQWGTYFGGDRGDEGFSIAVSGSAIYLCGNATSLTDIATSDALQTSLGGSSDAFVASFNKDGTRRWGSYYGGEDVEDGVSIHVDAGGSVYFCSSTWSDQSVSSAGSHQPTFGGSIDAFLVKICGASTPVLHMAPDSSVCEGEQTVISLTPTFTHARWYDGTTPLSQLNDSTSYRTSPSLTVGDHAMWVEITDGDCTLRSDTLVVHVRAQPLVTLLHDTTVCTGTALQLRSLATRGQSPYRTTWTPRTGLDDPTRAAPIATVQQPSTYTCTITDANGCVAVDSIVVVLYPQPRTSLPPVVSTCPDDSLRIGDTATSGTKPYTYAWSPSLGLSSPSVARPNALPLTSTMYHCTVTDAHGCVFQDSTLVQVRPRPAVRLVPSGRVVLCDTDSVVIRTDRSFTSYEWSKGGTAESIVVRDSGRYVVTVTDAVGCTGVSDTVVVVKAQAPTVAIRGPDAACTGTTVAYDVQGDSTLRCAWSVSGGGTILGSATIPHIVLTWSQIGTWQVTLDVRSAEGCTAHAALSVRVSAILHPVVLPAGPLTLCNGDRVVLRAAPGYASYRWNTGATEDSIVVTTSGRYYVHATAAAGCEGTSDTVNVMVRSSPPPTPVIVPPMARLCDGDSVVLTTSDQSYTDYHWSTGATTKSIVVRSAGVFHVTVTDVSGCTGTSVAVVITMSARPDATITSSTTTMVCEGTEVVLRARGGQGTYRWSTGETTDQIFATKSGLYSLAITSANGCVASSTFTLAMLSHRKGILSGQDAVCFTSTSTITLDTLDGTVLWDVVPSTVGAIVSGGGTSTLHVRWGSTQGAAMVRAIVTHTGGCIDTCVRKVQVDAALHPTVTTEGPREVCDGDSVHLVVTTGYTSYQWIDAGVAIIGATRADYVAHTSGSIACVVTNADGCTGSSDTVTVRVFPPIATPAILIAGASISSTTARSYQWYRSGMMLVGDTMQTIVVVLTGWYRVEITDDNGCSASSDSVWVRGTNRALVAVGMVGAVEPNQYVDVPILLKQAEGGDFEVAQRYHGVLRFNSTMLVPLTVGSTLVDGEVEFSGIHEPRMIGELQRIRFATVLGNDTCTDLHLERVEFVDARVDVMLEDNVFCESGLCVSNGEVRLLDPTAHFAVAPLYPNPAMHDGTLDYTLVERGRTQVMVMDVLGRVVRIVVDDVQQQGRHRVIIPFGDVGRGWYILVLRTPTQLHQQRVLVGGVQP